MELKDPNSPSLNDSSLPPMRCCVRLACKSMTYRQDERPGLLHFSDTQLYWCNITLDPVGPDQRDASPKLCQPGRACFQAEESP
ncbi:MAG: hypothetical protein WD738_14465 [Pirellulales bacterium]